MQSSVRTVLREVVQTSQRRCIAKGAKSAKPAKPTKPTKTTTSSKTTVDSEEINRFKRLAPTWWDTQGPMKELHNMNPARTQWAAGIILRENGRGSFASTKTVSGGLEGLKILDVGCGAGIATEAFAALGATVTGIDANPDAIEVAKLRLENEAKGIASHTSYVCGTVEEHLATHAGYYDAVVSFEVVEHVNRPSFFIKSLVSAAKPGAPLCLSTINKNPLSYALAIALGEYITRMVPVGTHSWEKFLTPAELEGMMRDAGCIVSETKGLQPCPSLFPPKLNWHVSNDTSVNYLMSGVKTLKANSI